MNGIVKLGSVVLLSVFMMVGCSSKDAVLETESVTVENVTHNGPVYVENVTSERIQHAILTAGRAEGWKMTEFKNNEVIAEKFGDDEATVSIKFSRDWYEVHSDGDDDIDDLVEAIEEQLNTHNRH